jgi:tetratricopeptide (TPR) repeat protein
VDDEVVESPAEPPAGEGEGGPPSWQDLEAEAILPVEAEVVEEVGGEVPATATAATTESEGLDVDLTALQEVSERLVPPPEQAAVAEPPLTEKVPAVAAEGPSEEMEEFLAEADFYLQQGLFDEAEFLYRKLTKLQPDSRDIAERIQRLEDAKARVEESAAARPPEGLDPLIARDEIAALENDLDRVLVDGRTPSVPGLKVSVSGGGGTGEGEFSDFLSELREELDTEEVSAPGPPVDDEESLSEIFQEFQEGLKEQLGEEDFETHYNLGIAYKEMGLLKEALGEFVLSEKSQDRKLDSLSMLALCFRDMGREEEAAAKIEEGLALAETGSDEEKGLLYDLADLYSCHGREADAFTMFDRLFAMDPSYRDVSSRSSRGHRSQPEAVERSDEGTERTTGKKKPKVSYL